MTVAARLQTWIGTEVLDGSGEKLGKLEDVYFRGEEPVAVSLRSGLAGRKHHVAGLRGALVSRDHLILDATADTLIATGSDGLGAEHLTKLGAHDEALHGLAPEQVESWTARKQRIDAQAQAQADADALEAEAEQRARDEDTATTKARSAEREVEEARQARDEAEARAQQAREGVDEPR